jgi:phosphatidylserine decarboxylase
VVLKQGEEMGRFMLGSTVVLLFRTRRASSSTRWEPGRSIRLGEAMATC